MLSHVGVGTNDLQKAKKFYDAVLAVIGSDEGVVETVQSGHKRLVYSDGKDLFLVSEPINGQPATIGNGVTIGFLCRSEEEVVKFHDVAVANGGVSIEDPPGLRAYSGFYLGYVRDLDGNKLCAFYNPPK
ncbi:Glyoxalase superfamily protein [Kluyveromyces marxianus]